ncbi:hypothetical protein MTO96_003676 [Rhipicephalus appendiculatus]
MVHRFVDDYLILFDNDPIAWPTEQGAAWMPLKGMDFGDENSRQEDEASGWIVAHSRKKQRQDFTPGDSPGPSAGTRSAHPKGPIKKLIAASRLPRLPKITTGLSFVPREAWTCASTPHARNAEAYAEVIRVGETLLEVSTYVTPPGDRCRGVVRGIDPELSDDRLGELFVHARNPKVLGVRRIKQTPTVIVLFDDRRLSDLRKAGAPLGRLSYSYCHHLPGLWGLIAPLRITRASRSAPSVEERIRRRIGPAKAGIRSPTSFGVEVDDAEKLTSSVGSSCPQQAAGPGFHQGGEPDQVHQGGEPDT